MRMRRKTWIVTVATVSVLAAIGLASCTSTRSPAAASPDAVANGVTQVNVTSQQEGIWASGEGKVTVIPDVATVNLGIEAQDTSVASAQSQAAEAMDKVMEALADSGVAKKDIQTQYFNIHRVTRWDGEDQREVTIGYRVSNMVSAKIRNMDGVGSVIDAVVTAGGDLVRVNGVSFSVEDPSAYHGEAREKAMADAKARAEDLAGLAGVRLGRATFVSESSYQPGPIYRQMAAPAFDSADGAATSISAGETDIILSVQVIYDILD
jgi:uncharacterized protein YggE